MKGANTNDNIQKIVDKHMVIKEKVTVCKMCNLLNNSLEYLNLIGQTPHSVFSYWLILGTVHGNAVYQSVH